jgi:putative hydrolase of the HAD superfamily
MIKNIVFDVGNVLLDYDPDSYMDRLGFDEKTKAAVSEAVFCSSLWNEADRGVMSDEELIAGFIANNPAYEDQIRTAFEKSGDTVKLLPYAETWVRSLKERGYHLYVLSNYGEYTYGQSKHKMKFLPYMDGIVFSFRCKLVKPDPAIYRYLCDKYQLIPSESVFIDDRKENIAYAEKAGLHGIVFEDYEQGSRELEKILNIFMDSLDSFN